MLDIEKLYYIMDYSGHYFRLNNRDELVIAKDKDEAMVFSFIEANLRLNTGKKGRFYFMSPVEESDATLPEKEEEVMTGSLADTIISIAKEVEQKNHPEFDYDLSGIDWKEYISHFAYVIEALSGYKDSLIKAESDVDLKICDIMHYIELCDTNKEEASRLVDLLKECRQYRRYVKDEMYCVDSFQRTLGTSSNLAKAKEAIRCIKGLETRMYTPRKLEELFADKDINIQAATKKVNEFAEPEEYVEETYEEKEMEVMVRRETAFDGKNNNWLGFAMQQAEFYKNARQYIVNLKLDIKEIETEIGNLMDEIDSSNCNVTQGYKLFKRLKELRIQRKEKEKELECLYILTERFDVDAVAEAFEDNVYELENVLNPDGRVNVYEEPIKISTEELPESETVAV